MAASSCKKNEREKTLVNSVSKAFQLLDLLANAPNCEMSIKDIVYVTGWNRTTVYRFLQTLSENGYVEMLPGRQVYRITFKLLDMSNTMLDSLDIKSLSLPHMIRLVNKWKVNCNLAIADHDSIIVIHNIKYDYSIPPLYNGRRGELPSCGTGKAMLSTWSEEAIQLFLNTHEIVAYTDKTITNKDELYKELLQIKRQGYALDRGEYLYGNYCVAAPIVGTSGYATAAISLSSSPDNFNKLPLEQVIEDIMSVAALISSQMRFNV